MNIKNKIIDKVSDVLSYPARRKAQKQVVNDSRNTEILKNRSDSDKKNFKWSVDPNGELNAAKQKQQKEALKKFTPPNMKGFKYGASTGM